MGRYSEKKQNTFIYRIIPLALLLWGTMVAAGGCLFTENLAKGNEQITEYEAPVQMKQATGIQESLTLTPQAWVEEKLRSMSLAEKVGQMFIVTPENLAAPKAIGATELTETSGDMITGIGDYKPGGIILMGGNIESDEQVKTMISDCQSATEIPLFMGVDEEGGIVSRLGGCDGISMENVGAMATIGATGDSKQAYAVGKRLAEGLQEYGFNMDFAPVADVLTNSANYEIGSRSFGSDAGLVSEMVTEEINGLQEHGVSAVTKHFPGHGAVRGNTHMSLQQVETTPEELRRVEFLPFQAAIREETDAILISHLALTQVNPEEPSSLSETVVEQYLRTELGYQGVVITDSFQMGSITENYTQAEAAKKAVQAGCDVILMPLEYDACYQGILAAVANGEITQERIDESCRRILLTKLKRGILVQE